MDLTTFLQAVLIVLSIVYMAMKIREHRNRRK
jgi:hypothetical protein